MRFLRSNRERYPGVRMLPPADFLTQRTSPLRKRLSVSRKQSGRVPTRASCSSRLQLKNCATRLNSTSSVSSTARPNWVKWYLLSLLRLDGGVPSSGCSQEEAAAWRVHKSQQPVVVRVADQLHDSYYRSRPDPARAECRGVQCGGDDVPSREAPAYPGTDFIIWAGRPDCSGLADYPTALR